MINIKNEIFQDGFDEHINQVFLDAFKRSGVLEEQINDIAAKAIDEALPQSAESILSSLKKRAPQLFKLKNRDKNNFEKRLKHIWGDALTLTEMFLHISIEVGYWINKTMREVQTTENGYLIEALTRLHGRACQVTGEVLCLLKSGYSAGAIARWRTLHEIAVVTILLSDHGDDLAKRYMDYEAVQVGKESCEYQLYAERLGEAPLSEEAMQDISTQRRKVAELYGAEFCRPYGWASSIINTKKISFRDLEKAASIDHFRPYYQLASASVHSNVDCITGKIDLLPDTDIVLAGPSNYGLYKPGKNTAISIFQVNVAAILSIKSSFTNLLVIKTMELLVQDISRAFQEAEERFDQINTQGKTV